MGSLATLYLLRCPSGSSPLGTALPGALQGAPRTPADPGNVAPAARDSDRRTMIEV